MPCPSTVVIKNAHKDLINNKEFYEKDSFAVSQYRIFTEEPHSAIMVNLRKLHPNVSFSELDRNADSSLQNN